MLSSIGKSFKIFPYQEISGIPNILKFFFLFVVQLSQFRFNEGCTGFKMGAPTVTTGNVGQWGGKDTRMERVLGRYSALTIELNRGVLIGKGREESGE